MAKTTWVQVDGSSRTFDIENGKSLMRGAVENDVAGIFAECGGACACATCQIWIDQIWVGRVPDPQPLEQSMIEGLDTELEHVRLSCQITMSESLDGIIVHVPLYL